jgi:hypothetical protein
MLLGISILGWIILAVAYLPVAALLAWIGRKRGFRSSAFAGTAALTSIPFVAAIIEGAYIEYHWRALCATVKTEEKRKVVVPGFFESRPTVGQEHRKQGSPKGFQHGFRFIEWQDKQGRYWRTEGFGYYEPELKTVRIEKPTARYHVHIPESAEPVSYLVQKSVTSIVDTETGETIAQKVTGGRWPAFVDRLWRQWFDATPTICEDKRIIWGATLIGIDHQKDAK